MSEEKTETDDEFDARYVAYFNRKDIDGWEIRKAYQGSDQCCRDTCHFNIISELILDEMDSNDIIRRKLTEVVLMVQTKIQAHLSVTL